MTSCWTSDWESPDPCLFQGSGARFSPVCRRGGVLHCRERVGGGGQKHTEREILCEGAAVSQHPHLGEEEEPEEETKAQTDTSG